MITTLRERERKKDGRREQYVERAVWNDEDKRDLLLRAIGNLYDKNDEKKGRFCIAKRTIEFDASNKISRKSINREINNSFYSVI